jgi:ubiquinone/menaquinone biosynthesis C-methylase UbiE
MFEKQFCKSAETYDKFAKIQYKLAKDLCESVKETVEGNNLTMLDLGSGTGYIAQNLNDFNVLSADISYNMCKKSKNISPTICCNIENIPIKNNSIDVITSSLVLHWCNIEKVISEIIRVAKKDCKIFLNLIGPNNFKELGYIFNNGEYINYIKSHLNIILNQEIYIEDFYNTKYSFNKMILKTGTYNKNSNIKILANFPITVNWHIIKLVCTIK